MVDVPEPDKDAYFSLGNVQLNSLLNAEVSEMGIEPEEVMEDLRSQGRKPYWIPAGASQHSMGAFGYARWALQLAVWEEQNDVCFDTVIVACGGGSTLAGMLVGDKIAGLSRRMIGVSIFPETADQMVRKVLSIAQRAARTLSLPESAVSVDNFSINDRFYAGAYGRYDEATARAVRTLAQTEGILLNPIYTGKAMAALMAGMNSGEFANSKNLLFVHTGGQSAMSAYPSFR